MSGLTDLQAQTALNVLTGYSPSIARYLALFTVVGTDAGTGFTEVSGSGYARAATTGGGGGTWNAASGSSPAQTSNNLAISFPTATGSWGTVIAWGIYDASSGGNLLAWDYLGNFTWNPVTVSSASPGVLTEPAHGYSIGDTVIFSTEYGGTAPSFSASNFTGQLVLAHAATDTFDVTNASTAVNTSSTGSGSVRKISPQTIGSGPVPAFNASTLVITL